MDQQKHTTRDGIIQDFRDKLLAGTLNTADELTALKALEAMAAFLAESHQQIRASLAALELAQPAGPYVRLSGAQEFGMTLYWASEWSANPPAWFAQWLSEHFIYRAAFDMLKEVLKGYEHLKMKPAEYAWLMQRVDKPGLVGDDGTIYGLAKYEQLDERWMIAALNYILNIVHPGDIHPFSQATIAVATLTAKDNKSEPVLGIVGDWGGGAYPECGANGVTLPSPAQRVQAALKQTPMDYLFHLGDTYYAGTDGSRLGPNSAHEEQENLVDMWPSQGAGRNYTLNSNHEMYGAAQGYFKTALAQSGLFNQQNGASMFALRYPLAQSGKSWLVLGLDSAYFSDKENGPSMYMVGAIGSKKFLDEHQRQMHEIARICNGHAGPIMVMTHHNPCDTITTQTNILYDQVVAAIGRAPTLWIWGHVHQCIIYNQMIIDAKSRGPVISSITKGRCCGHGAVPYGPAWGLEHSGLPYVAGTHDDAFPEGNPRVYNGYATVTLQKDGGFTERYFEVRLPGQPAVEAWSRCWNGSELIQAE